MPTSSTLKVSRREREILDALFAIGDSASVEQIRERLTDPPSYSAVRAMLVKLEAKGLIRHREDGPRYVYAPTTPKSAAQRTALRRLVEVFFAGSGGATMAALLKQEEWSSSELDALAAEIAAARKAGRRK